MPRTIAHSKDKRTKGKKQEQFLEAFGACASILRACKKTNVPRRTIYDWFEKDKVFKKEYDRTAVTALGALEDEAVRRAHEGVREPVYQMGGLAGHIKKYSDTLLIVLLKARAPEKYRERISQELTGKNGKPIRMESKSNVDYSQLSPEVLLAIMKAKKDEAAE